MRNTNEWATRGREGVYHDMLNDDWEARTYKSYKRSTAGQYRTYCPAQASDTLLGTVRRGYRLSAYCRPCQCRCLVQRRAI